MPEKSIYTSSVDAAQKIIERESSAHLPIGTTLTFSKSWSRARSYSMLRVESVTDYDK